MANLPTPPTVTAFRRSVAFLGRFRAERWLWVRAMKRGTPDHPKMKRLARLLNIEMWGAVGIMESIWHFGMRYCPMGDIGKFSDIEIADAIGWKGSAGELVSALINARWFDACPQNRLLIHDWPDHCDRSVAKYLKENKLTFACAQVRTCAHHGAHPGALSDSAPDSFSDSNSDSDSDPSPMLSLADKIPFPKLNEIFAAYPRRVAKDAAIPEIERAIRRLQQERGTDIHGAHMYLLSRVKAYARSEQAVKGEAKFIPNPDRWFREGRYNDDESVWKLNGKPMPDYEARLGKVQTY